MDRELEAGSLSSAVFLTAGSELEEVASTCASSRERFMVRRW